jgi:hypothetical protein
MISFMLTIAYLILILSIGSDFSIDSVPIRITCTSGHQEIYDNLSDYKESPMICGVPRRDDYIENYINDEFHLIYNGTKPNSRVRVISS